MGYLGFCYVESKSFEFRSEVSGGVQLAKRSRCIFRAVFLRWPSLFWLMQAMEGFIKGDDSNENWRTYRQGSTAYVVQRRGNEHGRFLELSEYGGGGR
jgi:hypothetical protein